MPPESPRRPSAGWRGPKKHVDRAQAAEPGWKKSPGAAPASPWKLSRGSKFGIAFGSLLTLVMGLAVLIYYIWPIPPAALVLAGSGYQENLSLPHNAHGWQGLEGLATWSQTPGEGWTKTTAMNLLGKKTIELKEGKDWAPSDWNRFREKTLVVVLSLHGGTDGQEPIFYLNAPLAGESPVTLKLDQILTDLEEIADKKKEVVLILDVTGVADHWSSGVVHNDFAHQLESLNERIKKRDNVVVLSASAPGQRSWVSDEWRKSIFLHYVTEGLRGPADADTNGYVSALELHRYVAGKVERWAHDNREAPQTPVLLPSGPEGEQRADNIHLVAVNFNIPKETHPAESPNRGFKPEDLERIVKAWEEHDKLQIMSPQPTAIMPVVWRVYETALIRCEQLLRAGDAASADKLFGLIADCQGQLQREARDGLADKADDLFLMALTVEMGLKDDDTRAHKVLLDLWGATNNDQSKRWEAEQSNAGIERLRLLLANKLLDRLTANDASGLEELQKAYEVLLTLDSGSNQRPVEAHVLALFARDVQKRKELGQPLPTPEEVRLILQTCCLAERTATSAAPLKSDKGPIPAYSEQVYPWIQKDLLKADALRQVGENLMFATDGDRRKTAKQRLNDAGDTYEIAAERAAVVRNALALYYEVTAWLPFQADFVASKRPLNKDELRDIKELARKIDKLADDLANLSIDTKELERNTLNAQKVFRNLWEPFQIQTNDLAQRHLRTAAHWHELDNVLQVPSLRASMRGTLLENLRKTSQGLNENTAPVDNPKEADQKLAAKLPQDLETDAHLRAQLALELLGKNWVEEYKDGTIDPEKNVNAAGKEIGRLGRLMAARIQKTHEEGIQKVPLEKAEADLRLGARLGRQLDGGQAWVLWDKKIPDPVAEYDQLKLRDFFYAMADRTHKDHWWNPTLRTTPFYSPSGLRFVNAGDALPLHNAVLQAARSDKGKQLRQSLENFTGLVLDRPGPEGSIPVNNHTKFLTEGRVTTQQGVPEGEMMFWLEADDKAIRTENGKTPHTDRIPHTVTARAPSDLQQYHLQRRIQGAGATVTVHYHVRYRGQEEVLPNPFVLTGSPTLVVRQYPPAEKARVAVIGDPDLLDKLKWQQMKIAIVFDRSGSMVGRKLDSALAALEEGLGSVGSGAEVSLWAFGNTDRGNENTRQTVDPDKVDKIEPWIKGANEGSHTALFVTKTRNVLPRGKPLSPIARAMDHVAKQELEKLQDADKFKVLLVLTDGEDNCFAASPRDEYDHDGDAVLQGQWKVNKVSDFLAKRFEGSDIKIMVACFQPRAAAALKEKVRKQFEVVKKINAHSEFDFIEDELALKKMFLKALGAQDLFFRMRDGGNDGDLIKLRKDAQTLPVRERNGTRSSSLLFDPRTYKARVSNVKQEDLLFKPGDVLLLDIRDKARDKVFGLPLFKDYVYGKSGRNLPLPEKSLNGWAVAALQNQYLRGKGQQMLVSVEKETGREADQGGLEMQPPKFVWFEVESQDGGEAGRLEWGNVGDVLGYPAPTWRLDLPTWPTNGAKPPLPKVRTWVWNQNPIEDPKVHKAFRHDAGDPLSKLDQPAVAGEEFTDVKVTVESQLVKDSPDASQLVEKDCLVVRAKYTKGRPILAKLDDGLKFRGEEHQYYDDTQQYVGMFWSVNEANARAAPFVLYLINVQKVQTAIGAPHAFEVKKDSGDHDLPPPEHFGLQNPP